MIVQKVTIHGYDKDGYGNPVGMVDEYEVVPKGTAKAVLGLCEDVEGINLHPQGWILKRARKLREALTTQEQGNNKENTK